MAGAEQKVIGKYMLGKTMDRTNDYSMELENVRGKHFSSFSDRLWANYNQAHMIYAEAAMKSMIGEDVDDIKMNIDENGEEMHVGDSNERQAPKHVETEIPTETTENWFAQQIGLLAAAEKYLQKRTWKDYIFHPFRSISENIAVSDLRDRVYGNNKKMPKAEIDTLTTVAREYYNKQHGHIEAVTRNGKIVVEANLGFQKNAETNKREPTKTANVALTLNEVKKREKNPRDFDIKLDRVLKQKAKAAKERAELQKQLDEAKRQEEEAKRKEEAAKQEREEVRNKKGLPKEAEELNEILEGDKPFIPEDNTVSQKEQDEFSRQVENEVGEARRDDEQLSKPANEQTAVKKEVNIE